MQSTYGLKEVNPSELSNRYERACAKLARIARGDTVHGGARAMVLAKRLEAMRSEIPANEIISDIYSASNYKVGQWGAYACPECGAAWFGPDKASQCCAQSEDFEAETPE